jgi:hypothetical protein
MTRRVYDLTSTPVPCGPHSRLAAEFWARVRWRNLKADAKGDRPPVYPAAAIIRTMITGRVDGAR